MKKSKRPGETFDCWFSYQELFYLHDAWKRERVRAMARRAFELGRNYEKLKLAGRNRDGHRK